MSVIYYSKVQLYCVMRSHSLPVARTRLSEDFVLVHRESFSRTSYHFSRTTLPRCYSSSQSRTPTIIWSFKSSACTLQDQCGWWSCLRYLYMTTRKQRQKLYMLEFPQRRHLSSVLLCYIESECIDSMSRVQQETLSF